MERKKKSYQTSACQWKVASGIHCFALLASTAFALPQSMSSHTYLSSSVPHPSWGEWVSGCVAQMPVGLNNNSGIGQVFLRTIKTFFRIIKYWIIFRCEKNAANRSLEHSLCQVLVEETSQLLVKTFCFRRNQFRVFIQNSRRKRIVCMLSDPVSSALCALSVR